ncbi:hypothetical protein, partial [Streptomyces anulatus]|uniref:hypothetical protein n=1 Tax=Streptomyces anulatus TaxID=1892 RepID=UPI0019419B40
MDEAVAADRKAGGKLRKSIGNSTSATTVALRCCHDPPHRATGLPMTGSMTDTTGGPPEPARTAAQPDRRPGGR